jgi:hypothetical protein
VTPGISADFLDFQVLIDEVQPPQVATFQLIPNTPNASIYFISNDVSILDGYSVYVTNSQNQQVYFSPIFQEVDEISYQNWGGSGLYVLYIIDPVGDIVTVKQIVLQ